MEKEMFIKVAAITITGGLVIKAVFDTFKDKKSEPKMIIDVEELDNEE